MKSIRRPDRRPGWLLCLPALLLTGACSFNLLATSLTVESQGTPPRAGTVNSFGHGPGGVAWAVNAKGLNLTVDGGASWRLALAGDYTTITDAQFLDARRGVVLGVDDTNVLIRTTADGGQTWNSAPVAPLANYRDAGAQGHILFTDLNHGRVLLLQASASDLSVADLYTTGDGGQSWTSTPGPAFGRMEFEGNLGWVAGGVAGGYLGVTRDGGRSWRRVELSSDQAAATARYAYDLPFFTDPRSAVLAVGIGKGLKGEGISGLAIFSTSDAGTTWARRSEPNIAKWPGGASVPMFDALSSSQWMLAAPTGSNIYSTANSGGDWEETSARDLASAVRSLDFIDTNHGLAFSTQGVCHGFNDKCDFPGIVQATTDGGATWNIVLS
ncbi:MAG: hypothetical protein ACYDAY_11320 [Candidatus Dormibacteria bacterium]